ncbi:MAG: TraB/GumN family protein, partial [Motiliproteus sp.]|nr:TraB/GumN family protein [Motiliproteus sp.]
PSLSLNALSHLKLWALTATLPLIEDQLRYGNQMAMDMRLYQQAQQNGKQVGGLETIDEQAAVFESFSEQENLTMLDMTLDYIEGAQMKNQPIMKETYDAYRSGQPDTFDRLLKNQLDLPQPLFDRFMKRLLADRNLRMADRIDALLIEKPESSFFIAVGAAHYGPDGGIQTLLEQKGYFITRVKP